MTTSITRRLFAAACAVAMSLAGGSAALAAKDKPIKVAAIYTVPVEQQWVSRINKALKAAEARGDITYAFSENVANTDYERVMREYAEQGMDLIVGEAFAVERAARSVAAEYPDIAFLMGSSFGPAQPNFAVFDNWIVNQTNNLNINGGCSPQVSDDSGNRFENILFLTN